MIKGLNHQMVKQTLVEVLSSGHRQVYHLTPDAGFGFADLNHGRVVVYDTAHNGPDGKPVVVNDAVESSRARFHWAQEDGTWKLQGSDVETKWKGDRPGLPGLAQPPGPTPPLRPLYPVEKLASRAQATSKPMPAMV